ncbi:conserved hypothetical protein [Histoplasma capsulatum var. duboisii H88]|uniref:Uncharacterized protein n=2 Tax=Ajellomyces capsulatus TaxID=5037 RepID=F0UAM6_AJEC8|nr:conserved hypothetical protein [Histoplasma capsulatum H143]EGC43735.1 conserved hypothetical protein [Histoplasma capsulatum var. duboisii H88]QSS49893.1 hypothetical protein I7I53_10395 [Histoplasma capsulatum var. duboisii H88]
MGHHGKRHWRHNGAHLKVRSALGAGNALVGAAIGHEDKRGGDTEPNLNPLENIDENTAAMVTVDEQGRFREGSNLKYLLARQAQESPRDPNMVVSTTVSTLPATVSNSELRPVTSLAETDSQSVVPSAPPNNSSVLSPVSGPVTASAPSSTNITAPENEPGTPSQPPEGDPTSPMSDSSVTFSNLPTSTVDMTSSSSASASSPAASSPSSTSSTSTAEHVTRPPFILLPISTHSASSVSTPPVIPVERLPAETTPHLLPITTSSPFSTPLSSLPLSSIFLASTSSTSLSPSSSSIPSSTTITSSSAMISSKSALMPTFASDFGGRGGGGGGGGNGDSTATGRSGTHTFVGDSPADTSGSPPDSTRKVVGGVVGGVASIVLLITVVLLLLRNRKRKTDYSHDLASGDRGIAAILHSGLPGVMSERSASTATGGSALGATTLFSKWRNSHQSTRTLEPPPSSERGFHKVSGRKITSVLESGGDGYDDPFGAAGERLYSETASADAGAANKKTGSLTTIAPILPQSSPTFQSRPAISHNKMSRRAGPIAQPLTSPPFGRPPSQEGDSSPRVVLRASPARTPLTSSADITTSTTMASAGSIALHPPPHESLPRLPIHQRVSGQDAIGRSMASSDGSRASRFTEGI